MMKRHLLLIVFLILFCSPALFADEQCEVVYTMLNVCSGTQQGDAHVMKFRDGKVYVIDAGIVGPVGGGRLVDHLKKEKITNIDKLFVSHAHIDHYGGVIDILTSHVTVQEVHLNIPDKGVCDQERPWGCDYYHYLSVSEAIKKKGITVKPIRSGDFFQPNPSVELQVLFVHNAIDPPAGRTDINDTSYIIKLRTGKQSILFAGDLNKKLGDFLSERNLSPLRATILKAPHHGTESAAKNNFFDAVSPEVALIPSPAELWKGERSQRIREYFQDRNIPAYVSGLHGDVTIMLWKDRYQIKYSSMPI